MTYLENTRSMVNPAVRLGYLFFALAIFISAGPSLARDGESSSRRIHCMGQSWRVNVFTTSDPEVVLIRGDDRVLFEIARALGKNLHWSVSDTSLVGEGGRRLTLGQTEHFAEGEDRDLPVAPQLVAGAVHVPSDGLGGLLDCRVTVKSGRNGAIYVEPLLQSISLVDENDGTANLQLKTSVPVRKKVFTLKNPKRTVIDLVGVALPKSIDGAEHPVLGEIRVGQFQLAPSITRVVLPSHGGISVNTERSLDLFEHKVAVRWPSSMQPGQKNTRVETVVIAPVPENSRQPVIKLSPSGSSASEPTPPPSTQENPDERTETQPVSQSKQDKPTLENVAWVKGRLKLSFNQPVSYEWARVNTGTKRFVVDFPGVIFPQRKVALDSSIPGLRSVRIVQNMPEPQPVVRLVCDLDSPLAVETEGANEKILYLDFPGRTVSSSEMPRGMGHTSKAAVQASPTGRTICIDAGHGGSDPGALNRTVGINESRVTLDIALELSRILKSQGWNVIMTRTTDRDVSWAGSSAKQELGARANVANNIGADLFVSIHANASVNPEINGTSIHWYKSSDYRLAKHLEGGVMSSTGRKNRGLVKNRFYVLAHTQMPAVLIETAFLTNRTEGQLLADPNYRKRIAKGIAAGLGVYASATFPSTAKK